MKIQIWVRDMEVAKQKEKNNDLGLNIEIREKEFTLTSLTFNKRKLSSFWIDNPENIDDETLSRDIALYIDGYYFRTPYTPEKEKVFKQIIEENEQEKFS